MSKHIIRLYDAKLHNDFIFQTKLLFGWRQIVEILQALFKDQLRARMLLERNDCVMQLRAILSHKYVVTSYNSLDFYQSFASL